MSAQQQIIMNGRVILAQLRRHNFSKAFFSLRGLGRGILQLF